MGIATQTVFKIKFILNYMCIFSICYVIYNVKLAVHNGFLANALFLFPFRYGEIEFGSHFTKRPFTGNALFL